MRGWYNEMPKIRKVLRVQGGGGGGGAGGTVVAKVAHVGGGTGKKKQTLEAYMKSSACLVCKGKLDTHNNNCKLINISHFIFLKKNKSNY